MKNLLQKSMAFLSITVLKKMIWLRHYQKNLQEKGQNHFQ